jgi:hypothetical protein
MSQLQALQMLFVTRNQLQYSDVEFIIESFPQLTTLAIDYLGLTGRFEFRKSCTSTTLTYAVCAALPESIGNLRNLTTLFMQGNALQGKRRVAPCRTSATSDIRCVKH